MSRLLPIGLVVCALAGSASALPPGIPDNIDLAVELGPLAGAPSAQTTLTFNRASRHKQSVYDARDEEKHTVVGVSLRELIDKVAPPKSADTIVLFFANGMRVIVPRSDKQLIDQLFIAFEHSPAYDEWELTYRLKNGTTIPCPRVVYQSEDPAFSPLRLTDTLKSVHFVTGRAYEAELAQPTRERPTSAGWMLYMQYCASCHGMGGQGATYAPDFISDMDAYRRVPALADTTTYAPPSLHEKVRGVVDGKMPVLKHVPDRDIVTIWRWLHAIHRGATK